MARYSQNTIINMLAQSDNAPTADAKGALFEDLILYLFNRVPGVDLYKRNVFNHSRAQEVDIAFWNKKQQNGFYFLHTMILTECKNLSRPVGSRDVSWFKEKIKSRGLEHGVMMATSGITGDPQELTNAHSIIIQALSDRIKILMINRTELLLLRNTYDLIRLLQGKLGELVLKQIVT